MGYINSFERANISTGDVTVNPTTYTEVAASPTISDQTGGSIVVPAGQFKVVIENRGLSNGGINTDITVNGETVPVGETWKFEALADPVNTNFMTSPAITVVTNGANVYYNYY